MRGPTREMLPFWSRRRRSARVFLIEKVSSIPIAPWTAPPLSSIAARSSFSESIAIVFPPSVHTIASISPRSSVDEAPASIAEMIAPSIFFVARRTTT